MAWTRFMDMHSGGGSKEDFELLFIEAPEDEAKVIFYNRFGHNPERVTCTCCGDDYSISEYETLEEATAYDRGLRWGMPVGERSGGRYIEVGEELPEGWEYRFYYGGEEPLTVADYLAAEHTGRWRDGRPVVIRADEIKPEERKGSIPEQGYVWVD